MDSLITLDIAGIATTLEIADPAMCRQVRERFGPFVVRAGPAPMRVAVEVVPGARFAAPRASGWVVDTVQDGERLSYRSVYDAGWIDFARGQAFLQIAPETSIENFIRVLYAHLVLRDGGLLLHAAGVVKNGGGFVFFGPSGSGKSTSARLSQGAGCTVLSDDLVIVRRHGECYHVHGVPFRGSERFVPLTRTDAPLLGLFALRKADAHTLQPLPVPAAVAQLVRVAPFVIAQADNGARVMALCADLAQRTFVGELRFRKDADFWRLIDEQVALVPSAA